MSSSISTSKTLANQNQNPEDLDEEEESEISISQIDQDNNSDDEREVDSLDSSSTSTEDNYHSRSQPPPPTVKIPIIQESKFVSQSKIYLRRKALDLCSWTDRFLIKMCIFTSRYHKELCLLFLFLASGFTLRHGVVKIRNPPQPTPFYNDADNYEPYLQDNFNGDYFNLVQRQIPFNPSFVFYYATWDTESVMTKPVFLQVAKHFHKTHDGAVKFYAVNCWHPEGQCRKNYKNLSHYPIFVAYIHGQSGIIYNGPIRAEMMISFINSLLKPLTRIDNEEELWEFRAKHDAIVLSYFNFTESDSTPNYETYLQMASRNFESDPFHQIGFCILLKKELGEKFFLTTSNAISLVLFNEIHTAKWQDGLKSTVVSQVIKWINERTASLPITYLYQVRNGFSNQPVGLAPINLSNELKKSPLLLLLTKRYFPSSYSPFYALVKEIALDYFNCNKSGNVTRLRRTVHRLNSEWIDNWRLERSYNINHENYVDWEIRNSALTKESLSNYESISGALNFTGFSCKSRRKFKFYAIDPTDVPHFIQLAFNLQGLVNSSVKNRNSSDPLAFIIDGKNEIVIPLRSFNISHIAQSLHDFSKKSSKTKDGNGNKLNRFWVEEKRDDILPSKYNEENSKSPIVKFNTEDLLDYVGNNGEYSTTSLLLLYTSKFCGFCTQAVTSFIRLAEFIKESYNLNLTFAKLDTYKNSLPFELTPDKIPTFVYMKNGNGTTESRVFSIEDQASTKNLLRFILSQLPPEKRIEASLESPICKVSYIVGNHSKKLTSSLEQEDEERNNCLSTNRMKVTSKIESLLNIIKESSLDIPEDYIYSKTNLWKIELLDHLRSLKLNLDIS